MNGKSSGKLLAVALCLSIFILLFSVSSISVLAYPKYVDCSSIAFPYQENTCVYPAGFELSNLNKSVNDFYKYDEYRCYYNKQVKCIGAMLPKNKAIQISYGDRSMDYLGYKLNGGYIYVEKKEGYWGDGKAGEYAGREMTDGVIVLDGSSVSSLGYGMKGGEIIVAGTGGSNVGYNMKGGKITVGGNVGTDVYSSVGRNMSGGEIIVKGNEFNVGFQMKGGKITVRGNITNILGWEMTGGEIIVEGDVNAIEQLGDGKITVAGTCKNLRRTWDRKGVISCGVCPFGVKSKKYPNGEIICKKQAAANFAVNSDVKSGYPYSFVNDEIIIKGNAGSGFGQFLSDGKLVLEGNAAGRLGLYMSGGQIFVKGNGGDFIGNDMTGGEITVDGICGSISRYWEGGTITCGKCPPGVVSKKYKNKEIICRQPGDKEIKNFMPRTLLNSEAVFSGNVYGDELDGYNSLGYGISEGSLTVKGNGGYLIGSLMTGGKLNIEGECSSIAPNWEGGTISCGVCPYGVESKKYASREIICKSTKNLDSSKINDIPIGYINKDIKISKNLGNGAGSFLAEGTMTIVGNVGDFLGNGMHSGTIVIKGNAGWYAGEFMQGGTIIIEGDAGESVGGHNAAYTYVKNTDTRLPPFPGKSTVKGDTPMFGGKIIVKGKCKSISEDWKGGTIVCGECPAGLSSFREAAYINCEQRYGYDWFCEPDITGLSGTKELICGSEPPDSDNDRIKDGLDKCPNTPKGEAADVTGCSASQKDSDGDGTKDLFDKCPNTPVSTKIDAAGCPIPTTAPPAEISCSEIAFKGDWFYGAFFGCLKNNISEYDIYKNSNYQCTVIDKKDSSNCIGAFLFDGRDITINNAQGNSLAGIGCEMSGGRIYVNGNGSYYLGCNMKGGQIIVNGSVSSQHYFSASYPAAGSGMSGGKILIYGDAENHLGEYMRDGLIHVKGNAGDYIGYGMSNGTIIIEGDAKSVGTGMHGGIIKIGKCISIDKDEWTGGIIECGVCSYGLKSMDDGKRKLVCKQESPSVINGDVGDDFAYGMSGGTVVINGNAGRGLASSMSGGVLVLNGNATRWAGNKMRGGTLIINGYGGDDAGIEMSRSGKIIVNGNVGERLGNTMYGGVIYVKGNANGYVGGTANSGTIYVEGSCGIPHQYKGSVKLYCNYKPTDSDNDGVADVIDECSGTSGREVVDALGCPVFQQKDSDADGIADNIDKCPSTPRGESADANGCSSSQKDSDADGVKDNIDRCQNTPLNELAYENGCSASQKDTDGDTVTDNIDKCSNTPKSETADLNGCSISQKDSDKDNVKDNIDKCPNTSLGESVDNNGCSSSQKDSDNDGIKDNADKCPNTPTNTKIDAAGCPIPTTAPGSPMPTPSPTSQDSDKDGFNDAVDKCPNTPQGEPLDDYGCSTSQKDADNDGVSDRYDMCFTPKGEKVNTAGCPISTTAPVSPSPLPTIPPTITTPPQTPQPQPIPPVLSQSQDSDKDGIVDSSDKCSNTPLGEPMDEYGCSTSQKDADKDGVSDRFDVCFNDPNVPVDANGCPIKTTITTPIQTTPEAPQQPTQPPVVSQPQDSDKDGFNDAIDKCSNTPQGEPLDDYGCSTSQKDRDGDGVSDRFDVCFNDPNVPVDANGCPIKTTTQRLASRAQDSTQAQVTTGGSLYVASIPPDADVYLDYAYKGTTPITLTKLSQGQHFIKITKSGHSSYEKIVDIYPDQAHAISASLPKESGNLTVVSNPAGAEVFVDDSYRGETPVVVESLPFGNHDVKLTKDGYNDYVTTAYISQWQIARIDIALKPNKQTWSMLFGWLGFSR